MADILTPPVVSTLPQGLLRYLGIQSGGQMPRTMNPVINTEFPTFDLLLGQTDTDTAFVTTVNAVGQFPIVGAVVSSGKVSCCTEIGFRVATVAAEAIKCGVVIVTQNGTTISMSPTLTLAASTGDQLSLTSAKKVWLHPGDQLAVQVYSITTAGSITTNLQLRKSDMFW